MPQARGREQMDNTPTRKTNAEIFEDMISRALDKAAKENPEWYQYVLDHVLEWDFWQQSILGSTGLDVGVEKP